MKSQIKEVYQGSEPVMDKGLLFSPSLEEIIKNERVYNGVLVVKIRDKVVVEVAINKDIYKRKKAIN